MALLLTSAPEWMTVHCRWCGDGKHDTDWHDRWGNAPDPDGVWRAEFGGSGAATGGGDG